MFMTTRRQFSSQEKMQILRLHLLEHQEGVPEGLPGDFDRVYPVLEVQLVFKSERELLGQRFGGRILGFIAAILGVPPDLVKNPCPIRLFLLFNLSFPH
jgi:hypothetical protein